MVLPADRGPASAALLDILSGEADAAGTLAAEVSAALESTPDIVFDDDLQLTLFCLYELHYGGIRDVSDDWEWDTALLAARGRIERAFEAALRARVPLPERPEPTAKAVAARLFEFTAADTGPSMSRFVAKKATHEQVAEFLTLRSIYTLKEADPHSWAIPRLSGRAKAALVEIQADEYGGGRPTRMHSAIFPRTMSAAGLDPAYGTYVDAVPAVTLASVNLISMFGLHRRLRGAIVGHLAAYEMTSSVPSRLYGDGLRRLGFDQDATWYYDEHVEADAVHEQIAAHDMAGGLVEAEPALLDDVLFGAAAGLAVDGWATERTMAAWAAGDSALRTPAAVR
ncbi:iron-containing redox enzyme family protein [Planctomonas psychrotolerans]|uniref:iron-containing redox enzyme family protein n=1 Tax=Planctomonas psychrotolerans TaxID=2528712 RepID=UPI001238783E